MLSFVFVVQAILFFLSSVITISHILVENYCTKIFICIAIILKLRKSRLNEKKNIVKKYCKLKVNVN